VHNCSVVSKSRHPFHTSQPYPQGPRAALDTSRAPTSDQISAETCARRANPRSSHSWLPQFKKERNLRASLMRARESDWKVRMLRRLHTYKYLVRASRPSFFSLHESFLFLLWCSPCPPRPPRPTLFHSSLRGQLYCTVLLCHHQFDSSRW
jgi:hypothetical protein